MCAHNYLAHAPCTYTIHADVTSRHRWVGMHSPLPMADTEPWHKISWNGKV
jgi:hypothetical protein